MSEIVIALLLLVPIFIVIAILNISNKKRRKKEQVKILEYTTEAIKKNGITAHFHRQLVHQTVIIDEKSRKLLIIDHNQEPLSYDICALDAIKRIEVIQQKQVFQPRGKGEKPEHIKTSIGVELIVDKTGGEQFLVLYDHLVHNIHQAAGFEKEAHQLQDKIIKAINGKQL